MGFNGVLTTRISIWLLSGFIMMGTHATSAELAENGLSLAEENFAYRAKNPEERVKAFLKIAESRVETVKRAAKKRVELDCVPILHGYVQALDGAWMGVSWGRATGANMADSVQVIEKTVARHLRLLKDIETSLPPQQKENLQQFRNAITKGHGPQVAWLDKDR